jgi:beta-glucosidase
MLGCWSTKDLSNFENATLLDGLKADGVDVSYTEAYTLTGRVDVAEIEKAAGKADVVIAAFGDYWEKSGEGNSSSKIELPGNQLEVARAIKFCGKPLVAVVFGGRPMAFPDLAELADAVVMAWNPGGCGGWGIADVLTGVVEPLGRLTVDIPRTTGVCPLFYSRTTTGRPAVVDKGNPFGKRFTSCYNDIEPSALYPFGFGLTYTTFAYSGETANVCGDEVVFSADVTNTGKRDGSELVQLYVRDNVAKIARPRRELKSFKRVELSRGETKHVEFRVPVANFGYWTKGSHVVEPGGFTAWIASDSDSGRPIGFDLVIPEQ